MQKTKVSIATFISIVSLTSCSIFQRHYWDWNKATKNDTIRYCLLIGQEDHNDSMDRTRGVRIALDTRPTKEGQKNNYNLEVPKEGKITLKGGTINDIKVPSKEFKTIESEHAEQKSLSGATWDPITANATAANWSAKHGENTTMFISNNDGMAEGALGASGWYENMPIFGYDANLSTLRYITQKRILGTIDSNTPAQCLAMCILIRNIIEYSKSGRNDKYNPCTEGFKSFFPNGDENDYKKEYGYLTSNVSFDGCGNDDDPLKDVDNPDANHAVLVDNNAITCFEDYGDYFLHGECASVFDYFKEDKTSPLEPTERVAKSEPNAKKVDGASTITVSHTYYSNTDVFFTGNMQKYFDIFQPMFNMDITKIEGDGTNEDKLVNQFAGAGKKDAYLINVVKQPDAMLYLDKIAQHHGLEPKDKWEDRSSVPVIFWNRQPSDADGNISKNVMNDKRFKFVYYVGFGAKQGGELQGKMVASWLNSAYVENYGK